MLSRLRGEMYERGYIMKVSRVSEMRELDWTAIEKFGITDELLMENAGQAAYSVLSK